MNTALLLSGGIDSVALAYWLRPAAAFTVNYGQLAADAELSAASQVCRELSIRHEIIRADCSQVGGGALTTQASAEIAPTKEWWPFRNQLLITLAGARMIALGMHACELAVGSVANDATYADGTSRFYADMDALMAAQEGGIRVRAPAIELTSVELVRASRIPLSILAWSHSCHRGNMMCGNCQGCWKHLDVFRRLDTPV